MEIKVEGTIIPSVDKPLYDFFEEPSTCPDDIEKALRDADDGEPIDIYINSPGGNMTAATEIYAMIRRNPNVKLHVAGEACSAATIIMCAGDCDISPTSLVMIHNVSTAAYGDHSDMEHMAEVLKTADAAVCSAYVEKTGKPAEHWLALMGQEKWFTAQEVVELGLCDRIAAPLTNGRCKFLTAADRLTYEAAKAKASAQLKLEKLKMR